MSQNVKIIDSIITVKTVVVDSKKITKTTLNVLPFLPPKWFELLDSGSLLILGKLAKDITLQLIKKRGYFEYEQFSFEYGLIIHFDEQLFISFIPRLGENPSFSQVLNDLSIEYKALRNELFGMRWPDEEPLEQAQCIELNSKLDSLGVEIRTQEEKIRSITGEIDRTVKYLLI